MAFIGTTPIQAFTSHIAPQNLSASVNGSTTVFTLNKAVATENDLEVFVGNVRQEPGSGKAYTASGTTLTFSEAPDSGMNVYVIYKGQAQITTTLSANSNITTPTITTPTITGNTTINTGNLIMGTAGKGIDFSAAVDIATGETVGSSVLDDYEEGIFQPSITADSAMGTVSYNHRYGYYTKIGNRILFEIYLSYAMSGEQDVQVFLSGLPFTSANDNSGRRAFPVVIGQWYNNVSKDTFIPPIAFINPNTSRVIMLWANGGTGEGIVDSDLQSAGSSGEIYVSGQYVHG